MNTNRRFQYFSIGLIWVWLGIFACIPILLVLATSLLSNSVDTNFIQLHLTFQNYIALIDTVYLKIFLHSFSLSGVVTLLCLLLGYPFAYILARLEEKYRAILLLLVIIPFWTSSLIRTYAIVILLKAKGILNAFLIHIGIIQLPLQLLYTNTAVLIGLVYTLLPFMILPLYANIEKLDTELLDAARDLGASRIRMFFKIILPLTWPGILAGCMLVFLPAMSMFYIPDLLGGAKSMLVGNLIVDQFLAAHNWPSGAAVSIMLTLLMGLLLGIYWYTASGNNKKEGATFL
jgi:spermidine/putrescine transport system permease protein